MVAYSKPLIPVAVFIDISGSTYNIRGYWTHTDKVVDQYGPDAIYYLWDDKCGVRVDFTAVKRQIASMQGHGGTYLGPIWQRMVTDDLHIDRLVLITDGCHVQGGHDIVRYVDLNNGARWAFCEAHIVTEHPDLSVIAGFIGKCEKGFSISTLTEVNLASSAIAMEQLIGIAADISTEQALVPVFDDMMGSIKAYRILRSVPFEVRQALVEMNTRILKSAADLCRLAAVSLGDIDSSPASVLAKAASAIATKGNVSDASMATKLISACDQAGSFSINDIRRDAVDRVGQQVPEPEPPVSGSDADPDWFKEKMSSLDSDMLALVARTLGKPLIDATDADAVRDCARNPMQFVIANRTLFDNLEQLVLRGDKKLSDFAGIAPCFVFGNSELHKAANKAFIARLFFGGTTFYGSYDLWVIVMWRLVRATMPESNLRVVADRFLAESSFLKADSKAKLGLDPTNTRPMTPTNIYEAFLYAMWGWTVYANSAPAYDTLRELFPVFEVMRDVVLLAGGELPAGLDDYVADVRSASRLLKRVKDVAKGGREAVLKDIKSAFCKTLDLGDGHHVLLDEAVEAVEAARAVREFDLVDSNTIHAGIGGVGKIVLGPSRPAVDVLRSLEIGQNFTATENAAECVPVKVNVSTMRPDVAAYVAHIDASSASGSKPVDGGISMYRRINDFALLHKRYPIKGDAADRRNFMLMLERKDARNGMLPANIDLTYEHVLDHMRDAFERRASEKTLDCRPEAIVDIINRGYDRKARIAMEAAFLRV